VALSYRSGIYYTSDDQKRDGARIRSLDVEASGLWPGKVVTE
jgi:peptide-methionine (S)-S-oxide reductase